MKYRAVLIALLATALAAPAFAASPATPPGKTRTMTANEAKPMPPAKPLDAMLSMMENEVVGVAEAMPADKYDFAPTNGRFTGVRTFAQQIRHVTQVNYALFHGWNVPGYVNPASLDHLKTKAELVKALKASYAFEHRAIATITAENAFLPVKTYEPPTATRATIAAFAMAHSMDHYGQLVEYLRDNGIIPPASRKH